MGRCRKKVRCMDKNYTGHSCGKCNTTGCTCTKKTYSTGNVNYNFSTYIEETCKCCDGTGTQIKCDGVRIYCPACNGEGKYRRYQQYPYVPYIPYTPVEPWQPVNPWPNPWEWPNQPYITWCDSTMEKNENIISNNNALEK